MTPLQYAIDNNHINAVALLLHHGANASITMMDRFSRYYQKEVVFASSAWMGEFESFPGDEIIISPTL